MAAITRTRVLTRPRRLVVLAFVATAVSGGVAYAITPHPSAPAPLPTPTAVAAARYLTAVERNRRGTWAVTELTTRSVLHGPELLKTPTRRVQRLPDSYTFGGGVLDRRLDGKVTSCTAAPPEVGKDISAGKLRCREGVGADAATVEAGVDAGLASIRQLVTGPAPLYSVAEDKAGCFVLVIRTYATLAPPFGREATFCYDPATGAQSRATLIKDGAESSDDVVDQTIATDISGTVTDADFALPPGTEPDRAAGTVLPAGTSSVTLPGTPEPKPPTTGTTIVVNDTP